MQGACHTLNRKSSAALWQLPARHNRLAEDFRARTGTANFPMISRSGSTAPFFGAFYREPTPRISEGYIGNASALKADGRASGAREGEGEGSVGGVALLGNSAPEAREGVGCAWPRAGRRGGGPARERLNRLSAAKPRRLGKRS